MNKEQETGDADKSAELRDDIWSALIESMGPDWDAGVGARAVMEIPAIAAAPDLLEELEQQADGASTIIALLAGQPGPVAASLRGMLSMQEQAARAAIARARGQSPAEQPETDQ